MQAFTQEIQWRHSMEGFNGGFQWSELMKTIEREWQSAPRRGELHWDGDNLNIRFWSTRTSRNLACNFKTHRHHYTNQFMSKPSMFSSPSLLPSLLAQQQQWAPQPPALENSIKNEEGWRHPSLDTCVVMYILTHTHLWKAVKRYAPRPLPEGWERLTNFKTQRCTLSHLCNLGIGANKKINQAGLFPLW